MNTIATTHTPRRWTRRLPEFFSMLGALMFLLLLMGFVGNMDYADEVAHENAMREEHDAVTRAYVLLQQAQARGCITDEQLYAMIDTARRVQQ